MQQNPQQSSQHYKEYNGYTGYSAQPSEPFNPQQYEQNMRSREEQPSSQSYQQPPFQGQQFMFYQQSYTPVSDGRGLAALSYLGGWLTGLLVFLFNRDSRLARFHALQSMIFFGTINVLSIVALFLLARLSDAYHIPGAPFLALLVVIFSFIMVVVGLVAWIVGMINAGQGKYYKLPFVGEFAEQVTNRNVNLK